MEVKLTIIVLVAVALVLDNPVVADFFFNHPLPKLNRIHESSRYVCVPGRTIVKITEKLSIVADAALSDSEEFKHRRELTRKTHMNSITDDESCRMCVCSADGRHEYCSNRPANNVNECLMLKGIMERHNMNLPYEHTRSLSNRIRRDYLWHNDEIPYNSKAKCYRGHSYYSNSLTANDTDIDIASDIDSLLGYDNDYACYYCVCSVDGTAAGCIHRDVQFCNFFKVIREEKAQRDRYTTLLEQDRPTYFRQLSWRMRRTMDAGMFDLIKSVGSSLPDQKCVPLVSEYTNCDEDNICTGCTKCVCSGEGQWVCEDVKECGFTTSLEDEQQIQTEDEMFDTALDMLQIEMKNTKINQMKQSKTPYVPDPQSTMDKNLLLDTVKEYRMDELMTSFMRPRRSTATKESKHIKRSIEKTSKNTNTSTNDTIKFYDTVDELNEDTLKELNGSGTLLAKKMDLIPQLAMRRSGDAGNNSKLLQIEYNQPKAYNQITDNKIDVSEHENKFDASHENLKSVLGNHTQKAKDKDLSKIVVNELKKGSEVIGDADAPVTSNITFTPENDTLTAMAFIAGNLLNKLWNMEKDATGSSIETDVMKQEKITDLLDLFKEPLNLRQESFLKNALEQLSSAIDKNKDVRNISLCENIEEAKKLLYDKNSTSAEDKTTVTIKSPCKKDVADEEEEKKKQATIKAISKINHVLELIRKFESIQAIISDLKHGPKLDFDLNHTTPTSRKLDTIDDSILTKDEKTSLNLFGNVLEKITKLLLPNRNNKKISNQLKSQNLFNGNDDKLKEKFKKMYNIDLANMTVTAKDKLVLDYLTHIDGNPNCLLNDNKQKTSTLPTIEGNILLNLSEFFKMKSFGDLVKLLEQEKQQEKQNLRSPIETTEQTGQEVETTTTLEVKKLPANFQDVDSKKFNSTKEKLKAHLKTIIEDLIELQNSKGVSVKGNIKISDALPCIYNVLNAGTEQVVTKEVEDIDATKKVVDIFKGIKKEAKAVALTKNVRRISGNNIIKERPKSAAIWERIIKNLNEKANQKSRRMLEDKVPKCYNEIKEMMDKLESASSTYKHVALKSEVAPAGKLVLLKALELDVRNSINVLEEIKLAFERLCKMPSDKFTELAEFVGNVATSINLTDKVNEKVKLETRKYFVDEINSNNKVLKTKLKRKPNLRYSEVQDRDDMRVSRDQVVNQLIRNRVQLYLNLKGDAEYDVRNDENYNIAKGVLYYLDSGNYNVARELFKMFVSQKKDNLANLLNNDSTNDKFAAKPPSLSEVPMRRMATHQKEPLLQFEDPSRHNKHINWVNQDHLIKQLLNIKNLGM